MLPFMARDLFKAISALLARIQKSVESVCKTVLVLSHGQAQVERGFSQNRELSVTNLSEKALIAKRAIVDHVTSVGGLENVVISKGLKMAASSARQAYHLYLEEEEEKKKRKDQKRQREEDMEEVERLAAKKKRKVEKEIRRLEDNADRMLDEAEIHASQLSGTGKCLEKIC
ncbi:AAK AK-HSDH: amino acid kinase superfamily aak domain-containing protein [Plakobranchus ocellatus]|uniref:AAK AK-HSDH: amino acid kinase superfamily aak domain-containing protein n=1 Tax=Plakobranchus ocellatus TaxID=259542 RepID=A0AAV4ABT7_9GAST|nr:AAK AK-HSDH: amino acid kinase superfamily aak domain-containing protein [Plakobranchus ocellatus]